MSGYMALQTLDGNGERDNETMNNNNRRLVTSVQYPDDEKSLLREELLQGVLTECGSRLGNALCRSNQEDLDFMYGHPYSGTLLHIAVQNNSLDTVKSLLRAGIKPDIKDLRGKRYTALHYAVSNGNSEILSSLLEFAVNVNTKEGEFSRTCLHLVALRWKTNEDSYKRTLDVLLKQPKLKIDTRESSGYTPLFLAAQKGWKYMTECLILKGADLDIKVGEKKVSDVINKKFPDLIDSIDFSKIEKAEKFYGDDLYDAMKDNDLDIFRKIIADINEYEANMKTNILEEDHGEYTLMNYASQNGLHEYIDILLKEGANPTHIDHTTSYSPILYAARNGYYRILESLTENMKKNHHLEKGALKVCDRRGETALHKIVKREQPQDNEYVDYARCLEVLLKFTKFLDLDSQDEFHNTPLHYAVLCDDQRFVHLLLTNGAHLGIKNKFGTLAISRIQPKVLENVLDDCVKYKNNVADRNFEIILKYNMLAPTLMDKHPESDCLKFLSGSKQHKSLLKHPILDTFLYLKWQRIRHYYFINLFAYSAFLLFLTTYIMLFYGNFTNNSFNATSSAINTQSGYSSNKGAKITLQILILIFWVYIALRELTQMLVSFKRYVKSFENWLELSILTMTAILIICPLSFSTQQGLSAWLVLTGWIELVLTLGRHPWFAVYITMFTKVSCNFLKFILMFSFMIVAFSLSFFLVFQNHENFINYSKTFLKTIAMSTGEIEYTDLPLTDFPVSSHLLFLLFVFLIVLVLINLLNGLAVSDIQAIQQEAELVSYVSRVELISYIESVFLANPFRKSRISQENGCCSKTIGNSKSNPLLRVLNYFGRKTLIFPKCLINREIKITPNQEFNRWHICDCHKLNLEESQIEAAKSIVLADSSRMADALAGLEERLDTVVKTVASLTELVKNNMRSSNLD